MSLRLRLPLEPCWVPPPQLCDQLVHWGSSRVRGRQSPFPPVIPQRGGARTTTPAAAKTGLPERPLMLSPIRSLRRRAAWSTYNSAWSAGSHQGLRHHRLATQPPVATSQRAAPKTSLADSPGSPSVRTPRLRKATTGYEARSPIRGLRYPRDTPTRQPTHPRHVRPQQTEQSPPVRSGEPRRLNARHSATKRAHRRRRRAIAVASEP